MKYQRIAPVALAALAAIVIAVLAFEPHVVPVRADSQALTGSWLLSISIPGAPPEKIAATFTSDGTYIQSSGGSVGHGAWMQKPGTLPGERTYLLTFIELFSDEAGTPQGHLKVWATIHLDETGDSFSAPFRFQAYGPDGRVLESGRGTAQGMKIGVEP